MAIPANVQSIVEGDDYVTVVSLPIAETNGYRFWGMEYTEAPLPGDSPLPIIVEDKETGRADAYAEDVPQAPDDYDDGMYEAAQWYFENRRTA